MMTVMMILITLTLESTRSSIRKYHATNITLLWYLLEMMLLLPWLLLLAIMLIPLVRWVLFYWFLRLLSSLFVVGVVALVMIVFVCLVGVVILDAIYCCCYCFFNRPGCWCWWRRFCWLVLGCVGHHRWASRMWEDCKRNRSKRSRLAHICTFKCKFYIRSW